MAVLKTVQSGTAVIASGTLSEAVTIAAIDTTKSFLVFSARADGSIPERSASSGKVTDSTTITFTRASTGGTVVIEISWYVVEFSSGVTVQRGSELIDAATKNVTITAVDLAKSFPLISFSIVGAKYNLDDNVKAKLTSTTNLELNGDNTFGVGTVEWQVIEFDGSSVQTGDVSFSTTDISKTATITGVNLTKSLLIFSQKNPSVANLNVASHVLRGRITSTTQLTFDRDEAGSLSIELTWFVVEFTDGTVIQSGSENFGTGDTLKNVAITAIDAAKAVAMAGGMWGRYGKSAENTSGNYGSVQNTLTLTTPTNLQIERAITDSAASDVSWFVAEFAARRIFVVT